MDLGELIENTAEFWRVRARQKGIELNFHIMLDVPIGLVGDPVRLRQVITNLVGNAIKFTGKGEVVLHVQNDPGSSEAVSLLFRVSDTGIGIPPEKLESIFDAFTQADTSTTRQYGGTGLGLTISRRLVELMGGRIWVEGEPGRGSSLSFTARFGSRTGADGHRLPTTVDLKGLKTLIVDDDATHRAVLGEILSEPSEMPRVFRSTPGLGKAATGGTGLMSPPGIAEDRRALHLLLVEDSGDNRLLVQAYLKDTGYQIDTAENGGIAVGKFISGGYDLVLMDMQMPVMDGYAATRAIRKWELERELPRPDNCADCVGVSRVDREEHGRRVYCPYYQACKKGNAHGGHI